MRQPERVIVDPLAVAQAAGAARNVGQVAFEVAATLRPLSSAAGAFLPAAAAAFERLQAAWVAEVERLGADVDALAQNAEAAAADYVLTDLTAGRALTAVSAGGG